MKVTCISFREMVRGSLVGFAELEIGDWQLVIRDVKLLRTNDNPWVALPSTSYQTKTGETRYRNIIEFSSKDAAEDFKAAAIEEIERFRQHDEKRSNVHRFQRRASAR